MFLLVEDGCVVGAVTKSTCALSQVCDKTLGECRSHIELLRLAGGHEVAGARRCRSEFRVEAKVLSGDQGV